jgi:hypothetical protein
MCFCQEIKVCLGLDDVFLSTDLWCRNWVANEWRRRNIMRKVSAGKTRKNILDMFHLFSAVFLYYFENLKFEIALFPI